MDGGAAAHKILSDGVRAASAGAPRSGRERVTYRIPSGSMEPAMLMGSWLAVDTLAYGAHIPCTDLSLPGYDHPSRGDIVVLESPYQADAAAIGNPPRPIIDSSLATPTRARSR